MSIGKINKVLVMYKKSAYRAYFLEPKSSLFRRQSQFDKRELKQFRASHDMHYRTLTSVLEYLREKKISFKACGRGRKVNFKPFDCVITVGGDGTFLEAARHVKHQMMLGINSDPQQSTGKFCFASSFNFRKHIDRLIKNNYKVKKYQRLKLRLVDLAKSVNVLNDILVCHENPAAMSRYYLTVGKMREEQRSSGLWIATAAGSSGAMRSAGGKVMKDDDKRIQYFPRELQYRKGSQYQLKGGIIDSKEEIKIQSLVRKGMIYVDGAHQKYPFNFCGTIRVSLSKEPLKIVVSS